MKAKKVRRRHAQMVTVKTVSGAKVILEIDYANGRLTVRKGTAASGAYRYNWKVPAAKGRVHLVASVTAPDGGSGTAHGTFVIR